MDEKLISAMSAFYSDLERELSLLGLTCRGCGECCRFDRAEHVLYASRLEKQYLLAVDAVPENPSAEADLLMRGFRCPFQSGNSCLARRGRVLGCRLHFCDSPSPVDTGMAEDWHNRLKSLHKELGAEWEYAPLLPL